MLHDWYLISQGTLIATLLFSVTVMWTMRGGSRPKTLLAIIATALLAYVVMSSVSYWLQPAFRIEKLDFSYSLVSTAAVGMIYLYFRLLMEPWKSYRKLAVWSICLLAGSILMYFIIAKFFTAPPTLYSFSDVVAGWSHPAILLKITVFLAFVAALILAGIKAFSMYFRHKDTIAARFSFREGISLLWIPHMIGIYAVYGAWTIYDQLISGTLGWELIVSNFFYTVFYMIINLMGLRQQDIYTKAEVEAEAGGSQPEVQPTNGNGISTHARNKLKNDLIRLMETGHEYRNPGLRLDDVVRALNTNRTYLSAVLREDFNENFIGFVNRYRIREAHKLLSDGTAPLMIKEIADLVGFKSISSFNTFFKRETGLSPTEFRERLQ